MVFAYHDLGIGLSTSENVMMNVEQNTESVGMGQIFTLTMT